MMGHFPIVADPATSMALLIPSRFLAGWVG